VDKVLGQTDHTSHTQKTAKSLEKPHLEIKTNKERTDCRGRIKEINTKHKWQKKGKS
jgi:hypothetical protein